MWLMEILWSPLQVFHLWGKKEFCRTGSHQSISGGRAVGVCVWECPNHRESFSRCLGIRRSHRAVGRRAELLHCCNWVDFLRCSNAGNAIPWCPCKPRSTPWISDWFLAVGWGGSRAGPAGLPEQSRDVTFSECIGSTDHHAIRGRH